MQVPGRQLFCSGYPHGIGEQSKTLLIKDSYANSFVPFPYTVFPGDRDGRSEVLFRYDRGYYGYV